jgi:hypothetical protein
LKGLEIPFPPFNLTGFKDAKWVVNGFEVQTFETIAELNAGATEGEA